MRSFPGAYSSVEILHPLDRRYGHTGIPHRTDAVATGISGQNVAVSEAPGPSLGKITPKTSDTAKSGCI